MITITLDKVRGSFNPKAILTPAQKMTKKLLDKFGLTVRRTQMNSMKRGKIGPRGGKIPSQIGKPPARHSRLLDIKRTVFSFTDVPKKDVVIGMVLLAGQPRGDRAMPGVLEHSGTATIKTGRGMARTKNVTVRERPSSVPAFQKTVKKQLPALIAGGIMREV